MPVDIRGKTIVVTGGSKGMGRVFVDTLAGMGANVACLARPSSQLNELRDSSPDNLIAIACDVSQPDQVEDAISTCVERFGGLDAVVNNAALFQPFLIEGCAPEQVERHFNINVLGPIWCTRAAIPHLKKSRGQIISISSESVRNPFPFLSVYAATKGALETFSSAMREELREDGIRVTVLRSGAVSNSTASQSWDEQATKDFFETIARTGHAAMSGVPASQASMAEALCAILSLPEDVNVDLIEVRGAGAGLVTDHVNKNK